MGEDEGIHGSGQSSQDFSRILTSKSFHFPRNFQELYIEVIEVIIQKTGSKKLKNHRIIIDSLLVEDGYSSKVHSKLAFESTGVLAQAELGKDPNLPKTEVPREKAAGLQVPQDQVSASKLQPMR